MRKIPEAPKPSFHGLFIASTKEILGSMVLHSVFYFMGEGSD